MKTFLGFIEYYKNTINRIFTAFFGVKMVTCFGDSEKSMHLAPLRPIGNKEIMTWKLNFIPLNVPSNRSKKIYTI